MDEHPTEHELRTIRKWDLTQKPVEGLLEYLHRIWWAANWGYKLSGKRVLRLELHTAGWSGNEDIIAALRHNYLFWSIFWVKHIRGGHYWFVIPLRWTVQKKAASIRLEKGNPQPQRGGEV